MMVADRYDPPTMKLDLWQKDLALIAEFVRDAGARAPLFLATLPLYEAAMGAGLGPLDTAAVRRVFGTAAGVTAASERADSA
jgi:3-hydroxyisobutyrate dehydrogenase-like beta-hydroxyacid dehydrogenase